MNLYNFRPIMDPDTFLPGFEYLKDVTNWLTLNQIEYSFKRNVCQETFEPYLMLIIDEDKDATAFMVKWGELVNELTK